MKDDVDDDDEVGPLVSSNGSPFASSSPSSRGGSGGLGIVVAVVVVVVVLVVVPLEVVLVVACVAKVEVAAVVDDDVVVDTAVRGASVRSVLVGWGVVNSCDILSGDVFSSMSALWNSFRVSAMVLVTTSNSESSSRFRIFLFTVARVFHSLPLLCDVASLSIKGWHASIVSGIPTVC